MVTILNSPHSFIRFNSEPVDSFCIWGDVNFCLPVYDQADIAFQFVIEGTVEEIDTLCTLDNSGVEVSIIEECNDTPLIVFAEKPARYRLSDTQILYNWNHGLPNFISVIDVNKCFKVQIELTELEQTFCSNCFERIADDCFTSVIEYGNDEDAFGFKYCYSGELPGGNVELDCEPTIVQFINQPSIIIPYTALLQAKYGQFPTVQVWIYDGLGQLVNSGVSVSFDNYPPSYITADFGGVANGIIVIR